MKGTVIIIPADVHKPIEQQEFAAPPTLEFLQGSVGGYIELVPYFHKYESHSCAAFCNEEGKHRKLTYNTRATVLWHAQTASMGNDDYLVGDVVILYGDEDFMSAL